MSGSITRKGLAWTVHQDDPQEDVTLSECTPTEWGTLEGTASQTIFNNAASTIWGTAFDDVTVAGKAGMRQILDAGLP